MPYHPKAIISYIRNKLHGIHGQQECLTPYYRGFKGIITSIIDQPGKWKFEGIYKILNATDVLIIELPVGMWTDDYKGYLEMIIDTKKKSVIRDYEDNSTDKDVNIIIKFAKGYLQQISSIELEKLLKMTVIKTTHNMHLFNSNEQLKKYKDVEEIIDEFYEERLKMYEKRRQYRITSISLLLRTINNKVNYINGLLTNKLDLRGKASKTIEDMLIKYGLDKEKDSFHYLTKMYG